MQDKIILGMLSLKPMSLYELKKNMEKSTSMFYNTSIGSIHPACQKLLLSKLVLCEEQYEGKRQKKVYSITKKGIVAYKAWLVSPLGIGKIKDELLLRLFFFSEADHSWKEVLENYILEIQQLKESLYQQKLQNDIKSIPKEFQRKAYFQLATLDLGYDYYDFLEAWLKKFIKKKIPDEA